MDALLLGALGRLRQFAQAMTPTASPVDLALPAALALLEAAGSGFKLVGGIAVVHHGYLRTTEDIEALVEAEGPAKLAACAKNHGFVVESRTRLRHAESGVALDLLVAGDPMPRVGSPRYPSPDDIAGSPTDATIVALAPLCQLKLLARRHRDLADVVELLKRLDEGRYLEIEAAMPPSLRPELAALRRDALEERELEG
jgi:hypothetical protein